MRKISKENIQEKLKKLLFSPDKNQLSTKLEDSPETIPEVVSLYLIKEKFIPTASFFELTHHPVEFENVIEGSRLDYTFHALNMDEDAIEDNILKFDIVSFIIESNPGEFKYKIYQIGEKYESDNFSLEDLQFLADANFDAEKFNKAIDYYLKILGIIPKDVVTLTNLGQAFVSVGKYFQAIDFYRKAIDLKPTDSGIWYNLSLAYEYNNEPEKAKDARKKAQELNL